jgi:hypothetical protein
MSEFMGDEIATCEVEDGADLGKRKGVVRGAPDE